MTLTPDQYALSTACILGTFLAAVVVAAFLAGVKR